VQKKLPSLVSPFVKAMFLVEGADINAVSEIVIVEIKGKALERGVDEKRHDVDNYHAATEIEDGKGI
jgi:hypothetical protein